MSAFVVNAADAQHKNAAGRRPHWTVLYAPHKFDDATNMQILQVIRQTCRTTLGTNIVNLTPQPTPEKQWKNSVFLQGDTQRVMDAVHNALALQLGIHVDARHRRRAHVELRDPVTGVLDVSRMYPSVNIDDVYLF